MADKKIIRFEVAVPTDEGFIGRSCGNPDCGRYFKIKFDTIQDNMYCPYCGQQFSREDLITPDQAKYVKDAAIEQAKEYAYGELNKMFADLARKSRGSKYVTFKHIPVRYRAKTVIPKYQELPVDSELICSNCQFNFQVYGIYGYCPGCGSENLQIYEENLANIKREIETSTNKQRALRHAYSDLVTTFETIAAARARAITQDTAHFQNLYDTKNFFKKQTGLDIFEGLDESKIRQLQRVFQKRHVYEHNKGIISDRYVRYMPEDKHLHGRKAELSLEEIENVVGILRVIIDKLVDVTTRSI